MHKENTGATMIAKLESLSVYRSVLLKTPGSFIYSMFERLDGHSGGKNQPLSVLAGLFEALVYRAEDSHLPQVGSLWQNLILELIITADNPFTRMTAGGKTGQTNPLAGAVETAAAADLNTLRELFDLDLTTVFADSGPYPDLIGRVNRGYMPEPPAGGPGLDIYNIKKELVNMPDWSGAASSLSAFHRRCGYGLYCQYHAFFWDGKEKKLSGIPDPDQIRLEHLVGYDRERNQVIENTERLLTGLPACNVLLYGDRGTGKSSTVKAMVHRYGRRGLRVVELPKAFLGDFRLLLSSLKNTGLKFIIFVDDLSFEEHETEYKQFKSVLDGSLQASPENVVIYATSNRRHLLREFFDERNREVHGSDTIQEKLSLSDRFGITILFQAPDQDLYLKIVEGLARQKGLDLSPDQLHSRALDWERWHNSRSGRTARQFVDYLQGE